MGWFALLLGTACGDPNPDPGGPSNGQGQLIVSIGGLAPGAVRAEDGSLECTTSHCVLPRSVPTSVTLVAVPSSGAVFAGWSGECSGTGPCKLDLRSSEHRVSASFSLPGTHSAAVGSEGAEDIYAAVQDAQGNTTVTGFLGAAASIEGRSLPQTTFLAQYAPSGALRWLVPLPLATGQGVKLVSEPSGALLVAGEFAGTIQTGPVQLTSAGGSDIALLRFDTDGQAVWGRSLGGSSDEQVFALHVAPLGKLHLSGHTARMQFDSNSLPAVDADFTVTFDSSGNVVRHDLREGVIAFATNAQGRTCATRRRQFSNEFLVDCQDADGSPAWTFSTNTRGPNGVSLQAAADDSFYLAGNSSSAVLEDSSTSGMFLMRFSAEGTRLWARVFPGTGPGTGSDRLQSMVLEPDGDVLLSGYAQSDTLDFGNATLVTRDTAGLGDQIFVARFDPDGANTWSMALGSSGKDRGQVLAVGPAGVALGGVFDGTVHFGDAERTGRAQDLFLLWLP